MPLPLSVASLTYSAAVPFSLHALTLQRVFSGFLLICGVALIRCSLHMLLGGDLEPLAHRAFLAEIPDAAFHATYAGQLLGLFLAYKVAQVNINSVLRYEMHLVYGSTPRASYY